MTKINKIPKRITAGCFSTKLKRGEESELMRNVCAKSFQSCPILCDLMYCSPPGSSAHGIFQARILEWVAMPSSRGSSWPSDSSHVSYVSCNGRRVLYHGCHLVGLCWIKSYLTNCISSVCLQHLVPNKCGFQENKGVYYFLSQSLYPSCLLALYRAPVSIYFKSI